MATDTSLQWGGRFAGAPDPALIARISALAPASLTAETLDLAEISSLFSA